MDIRNWRSKKVKDELKIGIVDGDGVIVFDGKVKPGKELVKLSKQVSNKYK